jgi:xylulokinase
VSGAQVLTLDLGTSATKVALWSDATLVAAGRAPIVTSHPEPGWAEQDPNDWWTSVVDACGRVRVQAPDAYERIESIGFTAARETFALFDDALRPLRTGVLWSDQRAGDAAADLGRADEFRARTGVVLNGACCAAKVVWVAKHDVALFRSARWVLAPRDWIVARLTGEVVTEPTLDSRTGFSSLTGDRMGSAADVAAARLPRLIPTTSVLRVAAGRDGDALGLRPGTAVVPGAGDRACEVLGTGADDDLVMVSWGTTTNVSVPHPGPLDALPAVAAVSRGALDGFVVEAGLSASGAAVAWLARVTECDHDELLARAARESQPGARGVIALPWLHGARAPFWRADARAAFLDLTAAHGPADLARAVVEAVALDVARCVELLAPSARALTLAGGGADNSLWRATVGAATGRPTVRRRHDDAASVGARLVLAAALGELMNLDDINPVVDVAEPDVELRDILAAVRSRSDRAVEAVLGIDDGSSTRVPPGVTPGARGARRRRGGRGPRGGRRDR